MAKIHTPVLDLDFGAGSVWDANGWTQSTRSDLTAFSSGNGTITSAGTIASGGARRILSAVHWNRNTTFGAFSAGFDVSATFAAPSGLGWAAGSSYMPGILFHWDGNIDSPSGYLLSVNSGNSTTVVTTLWRIDAGTFVSLGTRSQAVGLGANPLRMRLRSSVGFFTKRWEWRHWDATLSEPAATTGNGSWTAALDNTYANGRIAVVAVYDTSTTSAGIASGTVLTTQKLAVATLPSVGPPAPTLLLTGTSTSTTTAYTTSSLTFNWASGTAYALDASVWYNGVNYVCTQAHTATASLTPDQTGSTYWAPYGSDDARVWLAFISHSGSSGSANVVSGCGLSSTQLAGSAWAATTRRVSVHRLTGTPTDGALTITASGNNMTGISYVIVEVSDLASGAATTQPIASLPAVNYSTVTIGSATTSMTAGSGATADATPWVLLLYYATGSGGAHAPPLGFAELDESSRGTTTVITSSLGWTRVGISYQAAPTQATAATYGTVVVALQTNTTYNDGVFASVGFSA